MTSAPSRPYEPAGFREVWKVALPLIVSTGSHTLMQFCDRMFLSWYSGVSFQAVLPAGILAFTMLCGFMSVAGYTNAFVAQYHGAGDPRGCSRTTAQGCYIALLAFPFVLAMIPLGRWIIRNSGHPAAVIGEELTYFSILMWGSLAPMLGSALAGFFSGRGDTTTSMKAYVYANVANIGLDYVLIFGHLGFPRMGIAGAAWATLITSFISPAYLAFRYFARGVDREYATRHAFRFDRELFWRLVRFGTPSGIQLALDLTSFTLFVMLTGRLGELALSASNIALSINTLSFMPVIGIGIAATVLVGQYQGRRRPDLAAKAGWTALKMGLIHMGAMGLSFVLFPTFYISLFTNGQNGTLSFAEVYPTARLLLIMLALWGIGDACDLVLSKALSGAGDTKFVMYYSLACAYGVFVLGEIVIVFWLKLGIVAAWAWTTFYVLSMAIGFIWRFRGGRWKKIDLLGRGELPPEGPDAWTEAAERGAGTVVPPGPRE